MMRNRILQSCYAYMFQKIKTKQNTETGDFNVDQNKKNILREEFWRDSVLGILLLILPIKSETSCEVDTYQK